MRIMPAPQSQLLLLTVNYALSEMQHSTYTEHICWDVLHNSYYMLYMRFALSYAYLCNATFITRPEVNNLQYVAEKQVGQECTSSILACVPSIGLPLSGKGGPPSKACFVPSAFKWKGKRCLFVLAPSEDSSELKGRLPFFND